MGDDYVRIDNSTISYVPRRGNPVRLSWTDIHNIRERNYMQRLELYNARGLKVMNLEYQLEGFDRLRQLILEGASHLKGKYIRQREFHKTNVVHGILIFSVMLYGGMVWLAGEQGEYWAQWIFGGLITYTVFVFAKILRKVRVEYNHISLVYPF